MIFIKCYTIPLAPLSAFPVIISRVHCIFTYILVKQEGGIELDHSINASSPCCE